MIMTTKGEVDESTLEKKLISTPLPNNVGTSYQTQYWLNNELVRQDTHVILNPDVMVIKTDIGL